MIHLNTIKMEIFQPGNASEKKKSNPSCRPEKYLSQPKNVITYMHNSLRFSMIKNLVVTLRYFINVMTRSKMSIYRMMLNCFFFLQIK